MRPDRESLVIIPGVILNEDIAVIAKRYLLCWSCYLIKHSKIMLERPRRNLGSSVFLRIQERWSGATLLMRRLEPKTSEYHVSEVLPQCLLLVFRLSPCFASCKSSSPETGQVFHKVCQSFWFWNVIYSASFLQSIYISPFFFVYICNTMLSSSLLPWFLSTCKL